MTLNDLEPSQKGFLVNFSQYLDAAHISILNCDEMAGVRPRQSAYEIFSALNVDFSSLSPDPLGSWSPAQAGVKDFKDFGLRKSISFTRWPHGTSVGGVA